MRYISAVTPRRGAVFIWILFVMVLFLSACRSATQVNFYTLNSATPAHLVAEKIPPLTNLTVGIGSVALPDYLDRPQIVTLKTPHRLHLSEFHRWAGRLDAEITQVMVKNIALLLGTPQVVTFPWDQPEPPKIRVDFTFHHFEGVLGKTFHMQGLWRLTGNDPAEAALPRQFNQTMKINGSDYEALAMACNQALWELSREISVAVRAIKCK